MATHNRVRVMTETVIEEFQGDDRLQSIIVKNLTSVERQTLPAAAVFVYVGMQPNTQFVRDLLELNEYGFVTTKPNLETSIAGVFAAGDCRYGSTKQITSAVGEGATAALIVREYLERQGQKLKPIIDG